MQKLRVGVLRGGDIEHYDSSIAYGAELLLLLTDTLGDKFHINDIFIDKEGIWHFAGRPILPGDLMHRVDIVWNTSHPSYSQILNSISLPSVSVSQFTHALLRSPSFLREHMKSASINIPRHIVLPQYQSDFDGPKDEYILKKASEVWKRFSPPWIVKSFSPNTNSGIKVVKTFAELTDSIGELVNKSENILVEELIYGREARVHIVSGFRGEDSYVLPPSLATDNVDRLGAFRYDEKEKLINFAKEIYSHIEAAHYVDASIIMTPKGKMYLKKISFDPDFKDDSSLHRSLEYLGLEKRDVLEHLIKNRFYLKNK